MRNKRTHLENNFKPNVSFMYSLMRQVWGLKIKLYVEICSQSYDEMNVQKIDDDCWI